MEDGWLEGEGVVPSMDCLDWLAATFDRHFPGDLPLPYLYPTPEGGVEAEWSLGSQSIIFEIDLATHRGDWLCFDKQSDSEDTRSPLGTDVGYRNFGRVWEWLHKNFLNRCDAPLLNAYSCFPMQFAKWPDQTG